MRPSLAMFVLTVLAIEAPLLAAGRPVGFNAPDGTTLAGMLYESNLRPAPGIVLVHMLGRSKDEWALLAERLQEAGATVLALDLRGHGSSAGSAGDAGPHGRGCRCCHRLAGDTSKRAARGRGCRRRVARRQSGGHRRHQQGHRSRGCALVALA